MIPADPDHPPRTFHWSETRARLAPLAGERALVLEPKGRWFEDGQGDGSRRVHPPLVLPPAAGCGSLDAYLDALPDAPGKQLVVIMQAGATALGWCEGGEVVHTKAFKRYVVRGSGRAQQTHLSTKGKSRYGSRLRLRNAQRLLEETNERLVGWWSEHGAAEQVFVNAPTRLWASLFEVAVLPPFEKGAPTIRIPRDLPRPTTDVLRRAYRALCYGRIEGD